MSLFWFDNKAGIIHVFFSSPIMRDKQINMKCEVFKSSWLPEKSPG